MKKKFVNIIAAFIVLFTFINPANVSAITYDTVKEPEPHFFSNSPNPNKLEASVPILPKKDNTPVSRPNLEDAAISSLLSSHLSEEPTGYLQNQVEGREVQKITAPSAEVIAETRAMGQSFDCAVVTDVPKAECEALVALYNSTNGAGWAASTNWLVSSAVSNWSGVLVAGGRITVLSLSFNQLLGNIPPELGSLTNLQHLDLSSNQLTGSIPSELRDLTNLTVLHLPFNQLTGSIPPELGNLTNLQHLNLSSNQLTGSIPPELGSLTNLQLLWLYLNQLTGSVPPELSGLTNLQSLVLDSNHLTSSIPAELGNLTNLQEFHVNNNQLTGMIPPELGGLTNLQQLGLSMNQLTASIPQELGNLTNLQLLALSANQLTGSIPPELGNLTNLRDLLLHSNQLTGSIPLSFVNLQLLDGLYFNDTNLCEPNTSEFLAWKATVLSWQGTGTVCKEFCVGPSELNVCNLEPGDILLSRSPTYAAEFSIGGTYWTHAAMYIGEVAEQGGGQATVMHRLVEGQGYSAIDDDEVWETSLLTNDFWTGKDILDFAVIRPAFSSTVKESAIQYIRDKALAIGVTFEILAPKWTADKFYCSKLVWRAYRDSEGGGDLEVNVGYGSNLLDWWVTPDDLYYSIIKGSKLVQSKLRFPDEQIKLMIWSPAHIMLVDPEGRRTGYDSNTGTILEEIPFAAYTAPPEAEVETITAVGVGDDWTVIVTGYDSGNYVVEYSYLDWRTKNVLQNGVTEPGKIEEYPILDPVYPIYLPFTTK